MLSILLAYAVWRHVPKTGLFPRLYLYIGSGIFLASVLLQLAIVCYRNNLGLSRARVSYDLDTIKVRLHLRRPLKVEAGQYINIWVLSTSIWSMVQTHPFTVVSWSHKPQDSLDLFIQPCRGFTSDLNSLSKYGPTTSLVMFSGPHGQPSSTDAYGNILLMATGFGIASHLPYLKKLIYDHQARGALLRRIHLVWQIDDLGMPQGSTHVQKLTYSRYWNRCATTIERSSGRG